MLHHLSLKTTCVGTNMLSRLLHVCHPTAKQAVITAIDLLVVGGKMWCTVSVEKRDILLDYILTYIVIDENEGFNDSSLELLRTQLLALKACTTLVSVEPKLTIETTTMLKVQLVTFPYPCGYSFMHIAGMLCFFALPNEPSDVVDPLIDNLITLCDSFNIV
ncbi:hypothetical protein RJ641_025198 [Dillenia turbinata]|uniref:Uncharacterized protein n=1 Tax=Dillenia turbinata TaxID=194707 RepID=A0AAN8W9Z2_9MAGN